MLPKENRLTKKTDFTQVSKRGEVIQSKNFGLAYFRANNNKAPKFGFIVSNKISKKAVDRNKVKRVLRQVVRELVGDVKNGLLFVLLVKKSILGASQDELKRELEGKLRQIGALQ